MKNKNLYILLGGQLVSQIGDKFYMLALSFWVLEVTKSPTYMGIALFCSFFPAAVLGFFSGVIVDRYDRKKIIVITDFLRGIIIIGVVFLFYQNLLSVQIILAVQVLLSINTAFFDPSIPSIIPQIVEKDQLTRANSMTQLIRGISSIMGPVMGGISVAYFGYLFVFVFNAASYIISGFFELFIVVPKQKKEKGSESNLLIEFKEGIEFVFSNGQLLILLLIISLLHFFIGSIEAFFPILAQEMEGEGAQNLGYLQTALGIGIIVMSILISWINFQKNESNILFSAIFIIGLLYMIIAINFKWYITSVFSIFGFFFLFGGTIILAATCFRSIVQKSIPNEIAGRVFGVVGSVSDISIPLAMLVYGFLLTYFPSNLLLLYTGLTISIGAPTLFLLFKKYNTKSVAVYQP